MKFLKSFLSFFCTITTAIVAVVELNYLMAENPYVSEYILAQILFAGFVTALFSAILFGVDIKSKAVVIITAIAHYLIMCVVVCFLGLWFGWWEPGLQGIGIACGSVAVVYVLTFAVNYINNLKDAAELNKALDERNNLSE